MKGNVKRAMSGILTAVTILSSFMRPMTSFAAELPVEESKPPLYEDVKKEQLDADEVVTATDYEMEVGYKFDVQIDFCNLEIMDDEKVKVTFEEAKNDKKQDFSDHADTYTAVYYVEPVNKNHPKYQISGEIDCEGTICQNRKC